MAILVGCGKKGPDCKTQVADLMTYLRSFDHHGAMFQPQKDIQLVRRPELKATADHYAPVVMMSPLETDYQGAVQTRDSLAEKLAQDEWKIRHDLDIGRFPRHDPPDPMRLYLMIDGDVAWSRVAEVAATAAGAGFTHVGFAFAVPATGSPPPRTWVDDKMEKLEDSRGGNDATELASIFSGIVKTCPAMRKVFGAVGSEEGGDKAGQLIEGTGEALIDCDCDLDMAAFRSAMWQILGNRFPTAVVSIELARDGKPVEMAGTMKWRDASKQLVSGAVWLVAIGNRLRAA